MSDTKVLYDIENKTIILTSDSGYGNVTTKITFEYILELAAQIKKLQSPKK